MSHNKKRPCPKGIPGYVASAKGEKKPVYGVMAGPRVHTTSTFDIKTRYTPGLNLGMGMTKRS